MSGVQCPTTSEDPMDDAMDVGDGIIMKRAADPLDDHNGQSAALYDAFWPVFLLRRGLRQGKALPAPKYRHLMTYYDNRFAQDMGLFFCLANTRMRHEVNQAVSAKAESKPAEQQLESSRIPRESNCEFWLPARRTRPGPGEAIYDEDFEGLLKDAQADPKGVAAQDLLKKVLPFLNISSRQFF